MKGPRWPSGTTTSTRDLDQCGAFTWAGVEVVKRAQSMSATVLWSTIDPRAIEVVRSSGGAARLVRDAASRSRHSRRGGSRSAGPCGRQRGGHRQMCSRLGRVGVAPWPRGVDACPLWVGPTHKATAPDPGRSHHAVASPSSRDSLLSSGSGVKASGCRSRPSVPAGQPNDAVGRRRDHGHRPARSQVIEDASGVVDGIGRYACAQTW
jgi:hypothetical protein